MCFRIPGSCSVAVRTCRTGLPSCGCFVLPLDLSVTQVPGPTRCWAAPRGGEQAAATPFVREQCSHGSLVRLAHVFPLTPNPLPHSQHGAHPHPCHKLGGLWPLNPSPAFTPPTAQVGFVKGEVPRGWPQEGPSTHTLPHIATPLLGGQAPSHVGLRHREGLKGFGMRGLSSSWPGPGCCQRL